MGENKMSKLLIFGDSFGEENAYAYPPSHDMYQEHKKLISFHGILRNSGVFTSVTTYAVGGTDLWSQYQLFVKHNEPDATVLWFETHPGRIVSRCGVNLANYNSVLNRIEQHTTGYYKDNPDNEHKLKVLHAAKSYFEYLQREDYDLYAHKKMIDDIKKQSHRVTFIPCFHSCVTRVDGMGVLSDATILENNIFNNESRGHWDIRRNHITEENHVILAQQIIDHFKNGAQIWCNSFVEPQKSDFTKYFKKIT
jgi:hypothetical protein